MKIALITIHQANNYGAVLQAYATKKVLSKYGEVETINYDNKYLSRHLDLLRFSLSGRGIKMLIHDILRLPYRFAVILKFKNFVQSNMQLTELLTSKNLMSGKCKGYDVYICGSDQIWNPKIVNPDSRIDPIFFLSFANSKSKKISYASSIGPYEFNNDEITLVKKLLNDFTSISVRELDGQKKLSTMLNKTVTHVLDPTLLLSKEEWLRKLNINKIEIEEKYILVYSVPRSKLLKEAVVYFKEKLNYNVVALDQMLFPLTKVQQHVKNAGPIDFIQLFAGASFIITDSFHGTCFAINFEKPFISISPGKSSNRISSLFEILNIKNRMVTIAKEFDKIELTQENTKVMNNLDTFRKKSLNYLNESLGVK
jgi:polysaccharide pyruvyl transferase WcaK-like protein